MGCGSQKSLPQVKVIRIALIGARRSGKSALISCFLMRKFNLEYLPTTTANVGMKSYTFKDSSVVVTIEVWELNEIKALPSSFNFVILTLDCTHTTMDLVQELSEEIAAHNLLALARPFSIAITKSDCVQEDRANLQLLMEKTLAAPEGVKIYITSASDQMGIDAMFKDLARPEMPGIHAISRDTSVAALNEAHAIV